MTEPANDNRRARVLRFTCACGTPVFWITELEAPPLRCLCCASLETAPDARADRLERHQSWLAAAL